MTDYTLLAALSVPLALFAVFALGVASRFAASGDWGYVALAAVVVVCPFFIIVWRFGAAGRLGRLGRTGG